MLNLLEEQQPETLKLPEPVPLALHPAAVYLHSLGSDPKKATMVAGLDIMAKLLTNGECDAPDFELGCIALQAHSSAELCSREKVRAGIGQSNAVRRIGEC
jgi:hypothetical protein